MILGAAWFRFDEDDKQSRSDKLGSQDPLADLLGMAYLSEQTFRVPRSITQPERLGQFGLAFWTKPEEPPSRQTPDAARLDASRQIAVEMVSGAIDSVLGGSFDSSIWDGRMSILDDLAASLAWGRFSHMRAGLVPSEVDFASAWGAGLWSQPIASSSSGAAAAPGDPSGGSTASGPSARTHGVITPLHLGPPPTGANSAEDLIVAAPGLLSNDTDADNDSPLETRPGSAPAHGMLTYPDTSGGFERGCLVAGEAPIRGAAYTLKHR